jgi:hypothetical protein
MATGVTDQLWDVNDLVALWESYEQRRTGKSGVSAIKVVCYHHFLATGTVQKAKGTSNARPNQSCWSSVNIELLLMKRRIRLYDDCLLC